MMTTSQLGDLNRWKRLRIARTPLYKGLLMSNLGMTGLCARLLTMMLVKLLAMMLVARRHL